MNDPVCVFCRHNPADPRWRPFCSERCKLVDLARWVGGEYRIPVEPAEEPVDDQDDEDE